MPPKSKPKPGGKAPAATKPSVAAKATIAANTRGGKSTAGGRGRQTVRGGGVRVRGGLSKTGGRGGGPKDLAGSNPNTTRGVPSTSRHRVVQGGGSPSVPGVTGVASGGGSQSVAAGFTNPPSGGGIPVVPGPTGADSGGSSIRSDRFRTPIRQLQPRTAENSSGGRNFEIDGPSGQRRSLSASSERTASGSVSRTNLPAQYPQARQQRQSLNLNDLPVSRLEVPVHRQGNLRAVEIVEEEQDEEEEEEEEEEEQQEEEEEEDYYAEFAEQDPPSEEEDEVDASFVEAQVMDGNLNEAPQQNVQYAQNLVYLLGLPGRENLLCLSPIPIPNIQTIW
ncbi:hypothetical protein AALP_AAs42149U000100 [Arabis alpina]|uniref:Uncharacterized protein n=1 Tax=Arabis alpina TaxID=50452 RepID=A0A087FWV0_ARAAL|nr:hypothetical protein AALP_AAs42149U000100 [Arabis alpina]